MAKPIRRNRPVSRQIQRADIEGLVEKYTFLQDTRSEVIAELVEMGSSSNSTQTTDDVTEKMLVPIDLELERLAWGLVDSSTTDPSAIKAKALILRELLDQRASEISLALARSVAKDICDAF